MSFLKFLGIKRKPFVETYKAGLYFTKDVSREAKDFDERFNKLKKKADIDNIAKKFKYVKELDRDAMCYIRENRYHRDPTLTVLFTDDQYEGLESASAQVIDELFQEIENLGGEATLLIHPNETIRKSYSQRVEIKNNEK